MYDLVFKAMMISWSVKQMIEINYGHGMEWDGMTCMVHLTEGQTLS